MALRALSPSLNDPFTAINCTNRIATAFCSFTTDNMPKRLILDDKQTARIFTNEPTVQHIFNTTFDRLRQASQDNVSMLVHLLKTFQKILDVKADDKLLQSSIVRQTNIIKDVIEKQHFAPLDNANLHKLIDTIYDNVEHN